MVLRLILVGLVAGLGLSLPTRRDLDTMTRSARHWMNDRVAEWETPSLSEPGAYVFVVDPAEASLPLSTPAPASVPSPVFVSDEEFVDVLKDSVAGFVQDTLASTTREQDQFVKNSEPLTVLEPSKLQTIELPTEPVAAASEEWIPTDISLIAFEGWAEELAVSKPVELADATTVSNPIDQSFEAVVEATVVHFDQDASALAALARSPSDDWLSANENLDTGEAYALNRITDKGQESTAAAAEAGRSGNRLTNAVRLTREAVVAWASLIHGPAVVTLSR